MNAPAANPHIRAWRHKKPDALATALGRPNREQVSTERNQDSTVLQALELVNGTALTNRLQEGAKSILASELGRDQDVGHVISVLYVRAFDRPPSEEEVALAKPLLGSPQEKPEDRQANWEDFLWVMFQSPEFQFIH
jgi:hypothetical protein